MSELSRSGLRTKTGCLTCRNRRKKCDERGPTCSRCRLSNRPCIWPSSDELRDRRHGPRRNSASSSPGSGRDVVYVSSPALSLDSEALAGRLMARDVEPLVSQNFFDRYFDMIILPGCHPQFYHGWIQEIRSLMIQHPSLYYSILACSSSQVYSLHNVLPLKQLTLEYYGRSLKGVSQLLQTPDFATHNGLLMSIILLYIHGCLGQATFSDIPGHLNAAVNLIEFRFLRPGRAIEQPFDCIAVESVLYQIFIMSMGLWSSRGDHPEYPFDVNFWMKGENLLAQANLFPNDAPIANSPILGVPLKLLRLLLTIRQIYRQPDHLNQENIEDLQQEVDEWEVLVLTDVDDPTVEGHFSHYELYKNATCFYILIASLLLDQATEALETDVNIAEPQRTSSWQTRKMFEILEHYAGNDEWSKGYIVNWCIYTLGYFADSSETVKAVQQDLERRHGITGATQVQRFLGDLGIIWATRQLAESG